MPPSPILATVGAEPGAVIEGLGPLSRWGREPRDPVALGDAADPYLVPNLYGDGPKDQQVVRGVPNDFLGRETRQVNLRHPRRHAIALSLADTLPDGSSRGPDMAGGQ